MKSQQHHEGQQQSSHVQVYQRPRGEIQTGWFTVAGYVGTKVGLMGSWQVLEVGGYIGRQVGNQAMW